MKKLMMLGLLIGVAGTAALAAPVQCATNVATTLTANSTISLTGTCALGAVSFNNFAIYGASVPTQLSGFVASVSVDSSTNTLLFFYNNLGNSTSGYDDIHITFQGTPSTFIYGMTLGAGSSQGTAELVCSTSFIGNTENCGGTLLGSGSAGTGASATFNIGPNAGGTDYFLKDITGGSGVSQILAPEPMSLSMMGLGLLGLGALARKRGKL